MAAGPSTQVTDIVIPAIFTPYQQELTTQKARLIRTGALVRDALLDSLLVGGGITFNFPFFNDLDDDADNVSGDEIPDITAISESAGSPALPGALTDSIPFKITTHTQTAVRLSRNGSWSSADLAAALAGSDPQEAIARRVAFWWARKLQAIFIATWSGVNKDNGANDSGDYANEVAGAVFAQGVTNFTAEAAIDTVATMGDSEDELGVLMVHSVVKARMKKNNLIDAIPDARAEVGFDTFMGFQIVVDDAMPNGTATVLDDGSAGNAGTFESWFFGPGATRLGVGSPKVPVEVAREAAAGNGGGTEILHSRQEFSLHPVGHAYTGTAPDGGPSNAATTNNLNIAGSWNRVTAERNQVKFARLITREL